MKIKTVSLLTLGIMISCGKQHEMKIPRSDFSIVSSMENHSPIYLSDDNGTVSVNRTSSIGSTNWVFSVEKDMNAQKVLKEVKKLKDKKYSATIHPDDEGVYFSYMDTIHKNIAFLPFTEVLYTTKPISSEQSFIYYKKNQLFEFQGNTGLLESFDWTKAPHPVFKVTPDLTFEDYVQAKILLTKNAEIRKYISTIEVIE